MRTVRCSSRLLGEGVCLGACVSLGSVCLEGGVGGGVFAQGVSTQGKACERNDWQTGVKTLPCRNYVADGNNTI